MLGLNVRLDGYHTADWIKMTGARAARVVLHADHDLGRWAVTCHDRGIRLLWVYARESGDGFGSHLEALQFYANRYEGLLDEAQIGNEPDLESPSSWTMSQRDLAALGWTARYVLGNIPLVVGGLASGHPGWLDSCDIGWANAIGLQLYAKDAPNPHDVEDLPDVTTVTPAYAAYGLPLWMTEWGWWGDEARGYEETRDMATWARDAGVVERYFHFCADDTMVPPFGLYRADGSRKPAGQAFLDVATEGESVPIEPESPWIGDGLQKELGRRGYTPTTGEYGVPIVRATTPSGQERLLVWDADGASAWRKVG